MSNQKKKILREYKKVLETETDSAPKTPVATKIEEDVDQPPSTIKKSLQQLYEEKQQEIQKQRAEIMRIREERKKQFAEKKERRKQTTLKMLRKTKRGQPVLKSQIERMLGKLQKEDINDPHPADE